MVDVAQLVRASVCGTEGRGFESRLPPNFQNFFMGWFNKSTFNWSDYYLMKYITRFKNVLP